MAPDSSGRLDPIARADEQASTEIGRALFAGLLLSIAVMLLGLALVAVQGKNPTTHVVALDKIVPDLVHGSSAALLDAGILILFATPLLGVIVALVQFLRHGEQIFALITALLLLVLGAGFAVALH